MPGWDDPEVVRQFCARRVRYDDAGAANHARRSLPEPDWVWVRVCPVGRVAGDPHFHLYTVPPPGKG